MTRLFSVFSVAILALLCAPALEAAPADQELPAEAVLEAGDVPAVSSSQTEAEPAPAEEPDAIEDFGKDFGELLVPKSIPAYCPHNEPCLGGFFCEEFQKCPVPSCVNGKCQYE